MKQKFFTIWLCQLSILFATAQSEPKNEFKKSLGLKAGINLNHMNNIGFFNPRSQTGFMAGGYLSVPSKGLGYRTELLFSRQGYSYENNTKTGNVKLDYILLPQLATFNIGKLFQFQLGGQLAFLLNAQVDSSLGPSSIPSPEPRKPIDFFNKVNYGFAAGAEVMPVAGLLIGGRYNLFFNMLGGEVNTTPGTAYIPPYLPPYNSNLKNGVLQLYVGYQF